MSGGTVRITTWRLVKKAGGGSGEGEEVVEVEVEVKEGISGEEGTLWRLKQFKHLTTDP